MVSASLAVAGAGFLPWGDSGRRGRTSYELVALAHRLEVLDGAAATLARGWYLAPLAAAGAALATALGRDRLARALAAAVAVAGVVLATAVRSSPLLPRVGPSVTIGAAAVAGLGLVVGWAAGRSHR